MALKVRLPRSQNILNLSVKTVHADSSYAIKLDNIKPGWVSILIDMSKLIKDYKGNNDAGVEVDKTMGYKPDSTGDFYLQDFTLSAYISAGESLDIAYVLFCRFRKKIALSKLRPFEARNCGFINELPIVSMTCGSMLFF